MKTNSDFKNRQKLAMEEAMRMYKRSKKNEIQNDTQKENQNTNYGYLNIDIELDEAEKNNILHNKGTKTSYNFIETHMDINDENETIEEKNIFFNENECYDDIDNDKYSDADEYQKKLNEEYLNNFFNTIKINSTKDDINTNVVITNNGTKTNESIIKPRKRVKNNILKLDNEYSTKTMLNKIESIKKVSDTKTPKLIKRESNVVNQIKKEVHTPINAIESEPINIDDLKDIDKTIDTKEIDTTENNNHINLEDIDAIFKNKNKITKRKKYTNDKESFLINLERDMESEYKNTTKIKEDKKTIMDNIEKDIDMLWKNEKSDLQYETKNITLKKNSDKYKKK